MASRTKVVALALDSVITFDLAVVVQVFGRAPGFAGEPGAYELVTCAPRPGRVPTPDGVDLHVERGLDALADAELVVVPGRAEFDVRPPERVLHALRAAHARGARVASICVGAFVLGYAGLLDGRRATTHWAAAPRLAELFATCDVEPDVLYVDEGSVLTSAGLAAGLDLALHIVRCDHGAAAAAELACWNVVAPHRDGGQAQFIPTATVAEPPGLAATLEWALAHLDEHLDVEALARHAHLSPRTLARRFERELGATPKRWLHDQRVARARELLETTSLPVEDVARRAGFGSAAALRTHLRRRTARTPSGYRTTFAGRARV